MSKSGPLDKRNDDVLADAQRMMERAKATLRQSTGAVEVKRPAAREIVAGEIIAGQIVDVPRICAVHDKAYLASYVRGVNGLFQFSKTIKPNSLPVGAGNSGAGPEPETVKIDPDGPEEICAWCGAGPGVVSGKRYETILCNHCEAYICTGRTKDNFFRCRKSCGASGQIGDRWVDTKGSTRKEPDTKPATPPGRLASGAAALGGSNPLRLPASSPSGNPPKKAK
jgi:hypothetical protein